MHVQLCRHVQILLREVWVCLKRLHMIFMQLNVEVESWGPFPMFVMLVQISPREVQEETKGYTDLVQSGWY